MPKELEKITWRPRPPGLRDAPALTVMESPQFRVRLGSYKVQRTPKLKAFIGRIKALTAKHAAGAGGFKGRHLAKFGRGGSAAAAIQVRAHPRRVMVKSRVVKHSKYRGKGGAIAALRKHIDYLGRGAAGEGGGPGVVFDSLTDLSPEELWAFREKIVPDRHHFRFIVSPEAGSALDLKDYAREFVTAMEADLGTPLQWLGVVHYDTDNPHLHLMVRGKDSAGGDLVINREYMSHGMRLQAMEVATRHLGPRLPEEIERSLQRDLKADRVTGIDLRLAQAAALHPEGFVSALRSDNGSLAGERQRLATLTRLQHLESLGLAREIKPGVWRPDIDFIANLRQLSIRGDIIKLMHERMRGLDPGIATVIFNKENPPLKPIIGRVFSRGAEDEISDRQYLLVEARDGKAYYVPLSEYSEVEGQEARLGSIVRLRVQPKQTGGAADRNIVRFAVDHGGVYDAQVHTDEVEQTTRLPPGVSARDYVDSHLKRAHALASRGFVEILEENRFRIPANLLQRVATAPTGGRDSGRLIKIERLSVGDLDTQVNLNSVTWLDREIESGASVDAPARIGATRFEREFAEALKARAEHLRGLGLAEEVSGQTRMRAGFVGELYERKMRDAVRRLEGRYGEFKHLVAGQTLKGKVAAIEHLPSGPHAVLASAGEYSLVPANPHLAREVGRTIGLSIGRGRKVGAMDESPLNLAIRYRFLSFTPARKLGH